jgi:RimJ/RimL family protein N-acetyltransferase
MDSATGEFVFRPLDLLDLEFFNSVRNAASPFLHDKRVFSLDETIQWFKNGPPSKYWIAELKGVRIGYFRLIALDSETAMIGADLHVDFQGKGLGKSMYREFARGVLIPNGFHSCTLRVLRSNVRAYQLYLRLGFVQTSESVDDISMKMSVGHLARGLEAAS